MAAMDGFAHSWAYIIGINQYANGLPLLRTAAGDAARLAATLEHDHGYSVVLLIDAAATSAALQTLLTTTMPGAVGADDRVLVYFAGHGVALDGSDGPAGYIMPQDAHPDDRTSFLPMRALQAALAALPCRHLMLILDCCFAGAFRWAATRGSAVPGGGLLYRERYDRFIHDPAWQVLTSAAYDQRALDVLTGLGGRGMEGDHSPFACKLFDALSGAADLTPPHGDGVMTATELYSYMRDCLETATLDAHLGAQTPGLWPLPKHGKGEYIFLSPGKQPELPPAPPLTPENNPYRGLESYDEKHAALFFGRQALVTGLAAQVATLPLIAVLGASGTGKSSVVKAGLVPNRRAAGWTILGPMRPGAAPVQALDAVLPGSVPGVPLAVRLRAWRAEHPGPPVLLVVDQFEELVTLTGSAAERAHFLREIADALADPQVDLRLVLTLRSDYEPQFRGADSPLASWWQGSARFVVPPMTQDELRQVIEGPAEERALVFDPDSLVDRLINEVVQTPGGLPLLSFTLSELYRAYGTRHGDNRALSGADYDALGGVAGALTRRADEEYARLDAAHQATLQRLLLRMVALEGGGRTRRRVPRMELDYIDPAENSRVGAVVAAFVAARLLVEGRDEAGEAYVEPAHDALVQGWALLWTWTRDAGDTLLLRRRLTAAAGDWERGGRPGGLLWADDPRLPQLKQLRTADPSAFNRQETAFVAASSARHERDTLWLRAGVLALAVVAVLAIIAGLVASDQARIATVNADQMQKQAAVAESRRWAANAVPLLDEQPDLALLLSVEAYTAAPTDEAADALRRALFSSRPILAYLSAHD
ncbi:MAG TPA: caspase family protein, partial [Chloroflexia bacterium]|nr:caspase family protein [Chloroflexia bacterium]